MDDIQVEMHISYSGAILAYGMVTLEHSIRFPIQLRKYTCRNTGEEKSFLSFPRRRQNQKWVNVIDLDEKVHELILAAVLQEVKREIQTTVNLPEVEVISVNYVEPHVSPDAKAYICGVASVKTCGVKIHGITIKAGVKGLFLNMPQYRSDKGYKDIVYGITKEMQKQITEVVIRQYKEKFVVPNFGTERKKDE